VRSRRAARGDRHRRGRGVAVTAETETAVEPAAARETPRADHLFVILEAARPMAGGARLRLDELDEIVLGRGDDREIVIAGRTAEVRIPDKRMSTTHARLRRGLAGWELDDAGSKNGSRIDGEPATRAPLDDGARIELGQTALGFRTGLAHAGGPAAILEGPVVLGISTLLPALALRLDELVRLAPSRVSIVIGGETGTGKEVVARGVHAASGRTGAMIAVNCAALPAGLVEAELFGHRKGAFSGAVDERPGLVRAADRGTLLLDEVGDLPAAAQAALLRVLQEREVVAVGETRPVAVDVRVLAASHRDLAGLVAAGTFRADLYARLAGHVVTLPPLRERREDVGALIAGALARHGGAAASFTAEAAARLVASAWALNVRALDKAIEAALALAAGAPIGVEHLREVDAPPPPDEDDDALRARLIARLTEHRGNVTQVARAMGKARMQIQRWMRRFALDPAKFR